MSSLEQALQRALSVRINLQISLSQLPIVEEWMDIHMDRWLEHNPTPPEMPNGEGVTFLAMLGSDLKRVWWGAWGDPRGFVPKMADYFKLCNIAKSDAAVLDTIGEQLEPKLVGSWIGVWGGKVTTGWHFWDPHPWSKVEALFGTHEAKYQLKKYVEDSKLDRIERFTQSIGDSPFSEIELAVPGETVDAQVTALTQAFVHFTGAPLEKQLEERFRSMTQPTFTLAVRMRNGQVTRVGALAPGIAMADVQHVCTDAKVSADEKLPKVIGQLGEGIARVEYGRAGDRAGVDVYLEPTEPAAKRSEAAPSTQAN
ncbi:MAG: hypothetical protein M4D80_31995 [Myxococcota bacterium]|nr:hypothetical protein [Myxococcota bacterium]